jgi:hypothetical protein
MHFSLLGRWHESFARLRVTHPGSGQLTPMALAPGYHPHVNDARVTQKTGIACPMKNRRKFSECPSEWNVRWNVRRTGVTCGPPMVVRTARQ